MRWHWSKPTAADRPLTAEILRFAQNDKERSAVSRQQSQLRCPLCGKRFRAEDAAQCTTCALAKRCGLVMCPNCGYEFAVG